MLAVPFVSALPVREWRAVQGGSNGDSDENGGSNGSAEERSGRRSAGQSSEASQATTDRARAGAGGGPDWSEEAKSSWSEGAGSSCNTR